MAKSADAVGDVLHPNLDPEPNQPDGPHEGDLNGFNQSLLEGTLINTTFPVLLWRDLLT